MLDEFFKEVNLKISAYEIQSLDMLFTFSCAFNFHVFKYSSSSINLVGWVLSEFIDFCSFLLATKNIEMC